LEGELVSGEVYQTWKREVLLLDDDKNELILPKDQQIPTDIYHKGDTVRAVIHKVDNQNNNPKIILSRKFRALVSSSCADYLNWRFPKFTTDSLSSVPWLASQVSALRLPLRVTTTASTLWVLVWA